MITCAMNLVVAALLAGMPPAEEPALRLPWVFADHMVLQRDRAQPVWGEAAPGVEVTVTFAGAVARTRSEDDGRWRLELPSLATSAEGRTLHVQAGAESIALENLLVGDVWICAGQSNMDFPLNRATGGAEAAVSIPGLRLCDRNGTIGGGRRRLSTEQYEAIAPETYYRGSWQECQAESAATFSAVGFFFGRELTEELEVPVGLIDVSVGGSSTEGWIPLEVLRADPELAPLAEDYLESPLSHEFIRERTLFQLGDWVDAGRPEPRPRHFFEPGFLWEAAIEELANVSVRGVLWYQGESNAHLPRVADRLFRALVPTWRTAWGDETLPFCFVQLPAMGRPTWPEFREVQAGWLDLPATAMAVTIDTGHPTDVHPRDKRPVGERLCLAALRTVYDRDVEASGPTVRRTRADGPRLVIELDHAEGLAWVGGSEALALEIAGPDQQFHPARARIDGESLVLEAADVAEPVAARYAWSPVPSCGLVNGAGLPAAPFRVQIDRVE